MLTEKSEKQESSAMQVRLQEIQPHDAGGKNLVAGNIDLIKDVKVKIMVSVGQAELTVAELFALKDDSVIKLDAATTDPVEVLLDGKVIARGSLVAVGDRFGVSITEILPAGGR
jgi:flagellar motor switch protein FliN/FliY